MRCPSKRLLKTHYITLLCFCPLKCFYCFFEGSPLADSLDSQRIFLGSRSDIQHVKHHIITINRNIHKIILNSFRYKCICTPFNTYQHSTYVSVVYLLIHYKGEIKDFRIYSSTGRSRGKLFQFIIAL